VRDTNTLNLGGIAGIDTNSTCNTSILFNGTVVTFSGMGAIEVASNRASVVTLVPRM
jgi:hypothetical protein